MIISANSQSVEILLPKENAKHLVNSITKFLDSGGFSKMNILTKVLLEKALREYLAAMVQRGVITIASQGASWRFKIRAKAE
jgi:hypothetical protein